VDPSLNQNKGAKYSWKTGVKMGKFVRKETEIQETQLSLQSSNLRCLGNSELSRKQEFSSFF